MIRMTKQADYGIILLTHFASAGRHGNADVVFSARDLAQRSHLPQPIVTKVLKLLGRSGLLVSHRGIRGGYGLARPAATITVGEIITALEGPIAITQCAVHAEGCEQEPVCPVRHNWRQIDRAVRDALYAISLEDMSQPLMQGRLLIQPTIAEPTMGTHTSSAAFRSTSLAARPKPKGLDEELAGVSETEPPAPVAFRSSR